MATLVRGGVNAFHTAGAAKALTTSYVNGDEIDTLEADELWLSCVTAATATTSTDVNVQWSDDGGTTYHRLSVINSTIAGLVDTDDGEWIGPGANGNHSIGPIAIPSGVKLRVAAKRTNGAADSTLLAKATLLCSGR